ncbi:MAG: stage II sporulation protein E [Candidatus Carbobacillus altaicus]|nr:stage II sporulation protein E [Candidatus Carbobacillus altaicus]
MEALQKSDLWRASRLSVFGEMGWERFLTPFKVVWDRWLPKRALTLLFVSFLFGRSYILGELTPFALPFFAVATYFWRGEWPIILVGVLFGAVFSPLPHAAELALAVAFFTLLWGTLYRSWMHLLIALPLMVGLSTFGASILWRHLVTTPETVTYILAAVEAGLSMVLTVIFLQTLPLIQHEKLRQSIKQEELYALFIVWATLLTGTVGYAIGPLTVSSILSRYAVVVMAYVGGAATGATAGVITGLLLALSDVGALTELSLLGFSGLLAGLFRPSGRLSSAFGLFLGVLLLTVYTDQVGTLEQALFESLFAVLLFFLTPSATLGMLSKLIPGTKAYWEGQAERLRKTRDLMGERLHTVATMFASLANTFAEDEMRKERAAGAASMTKEGSGDIIEAVARSVCATCTRQSYCWSRHTEETVGALEDWIQIKKKQGERDRKDAPMWLRDHCMKLMPLEQALDDAHTNYVQKAKQRARLKEVRLLISDQLSGVAEMIEEFAEDIQREGLSARHQEINIRRWLEQNGIIVQSFDVISLAAGEIELIVSLIPFGDLITLRRTLKTALESLLGEPLKIIEEKTPNESLLTWKVTSSYPYQVSFSYAQVAKGGGVVCGDSALGIPIGRRMYAVVLSDGMGSSVEAEHVSQKAVRMLRDILSTGLDMTLAVRSVNALLSLRASEEMFATIDLVLIDLLSGEAKFLKIGAPPSFIRRGGAVMRIEGHNPPAGLTDARELDVISVKLRPHDTLIMVTDGVFAGELGSLQKERWLKRLVSEAPLADAERFADTILDQVAYAARYAPDDDVTVVAIKIESRDEAWVKVTMHATAPAS